MKKNALQEAAQVERVSAVILQALHGLGKVGVGPHIVAAGAFEALARFAVESAPATDSDEKIQMAVNALVQMFRRRVHEHHAKAKHGGVGHG